MNLFDANEKQCSSCCLFLPFWEFAHNGKSIDGREHVCMACKTDAQIVRLQKVLARLLQQREITMKKMAAIETRYMEIEALK